MRAQTGDIDERGGVGRVQGPGAFHMLRKTGRQGDLS